MKTAKKEKGWSNLQKKKGKRVGIISLASDHKICLKSVCNSDMICLSIHYSEKNKNKRCGCFKMCWLTDWIIHFIKAATSFFRPKKYVCGFVYTGSLDDACYTVYWGFLLCFQYKGKFIPENITKKCAYYFFKKRISLFVFQSVNSRYAPVFTQVP